MYLTANNFGLQEENINISKPQGKTTIIWKTGWGYHRKRRETDVQKERERGGIVQCFMQKEDKSLIN